MRHDTLYRHQQALDPSALTIIVAGVHAVVAAIDDCRNADRDPDTDPAIILLARHLGRIAEALPVGDDALRRQCAERVAIIRGQQSGPGRSPIPSSLRPEEQRLAA
ncbi:hypothetical protein [uncultured Sphingomonas sp.]|uniref:hypothetical protein n=1 Tax=uncultured Sphingomonas sp. TaxID=158754 RepID=UPI0030D86456